MATASPEREASTSAAARNFASAIRACPCSSMAAMLSESSRRSPTATAACVTAFAGVSAGRANAKTRRRSASVRRTRRRISRRRMRRISRGSSARRNAVVGNGTSGSFRRLRR
jgi:hypothetical protein